MHDAYTVPFRDKFFAVGRADLIVLRRNCKQLYKSTSGLALYGAIGL